MCVCVCVYVYIYMCVCVCIDRYCISRYNTNVESKELRFHLRLRRRVNPTFNPAAASSSALCA